MFRFEQEAYLYGLLVIPVLIAIFAAAWYFRRRAVRRFGELSLMRRLAPGLSRRRHILKFSIVLVALTAMIIAWANPQWGGKRREVLRKGIDLFIALDISQSMLAQDISPSRLERSKRFAQNLVDELGGNNIGVILFACNAFLSVPLTSDYGFVKLSLSTANPDQAASQGTSIGEAIGVAQRSFRGDNERHRAVIIISDGEDHDGSAAEAAREAYRSGTLIFTVGVGETEGAFVPVSQSGRGSFLRDGRGNPVRSRLNAETLEKVAQAGSGAYFNLSSSGNSVVEALRNRIDTIEKREFEDMAFTDFETYFQYFVAVALLLLVIEFLLSYRRIRRANQRDWFNV